MSRQRVSFFRSCFRDTHKFTRCYFWDPLIIFTVDIMQHDKNPWDHNRFLIAHKTPSWLFRLILEEIKFPKTKHFISSVLIQVHTRRFKVWDATTRPYPNRDESLLRLATELKYLEDSRNDPGNAPHTVAGAKLNIKPARNPVCL